MSGQIFYGKSADGSDVKEFEGLFINPNNPNEWSNTPYEIKRNLPKQKKWICKGKHQYKLTDTIEIDMGEGVLVTEIWNCQCGKVLG